MRWRSLVVAVLVLSILTWPSSAAEQNGASPDAQDVEEVLTTGTDPAPPSTPTARPAPTAMPSPGATLASDNFDDPATGVLPHSSSDPRYEVGYVGGEYLLRKVDIRSEVDPFVFLPATYRDAGLAVDARVVGDASGRVLALYCRVQPQTELSGYALLIVPDLQVVALARVDANRSTLLTEPQPAAALRPASQSNRIDLHCSGPVLSAVVNGSTVARAVDLTYREGQLGVSAGLFEGTGTVEVRLDNLLVTQLAEETSAPPTPAPAPSPYDGTWSGSSSAGGQVSFRVRGGAVQDMTIGYGELTGTSCTFLPAGGTLRPSSPAPIAGGSFSVTAGATVTMSSPEPGHPQPVAGEITVSLTGRFSSERSATGEVGISIWRPPLSREDAECQASMSAPWTATRQ